MRIFFAISLFCSSVAVAAEFEPVSVTPVNRPYCELSLSVDMGREVSCCGIRLVSDPNRWISYSPSHIRIWASEEPTGQWLTKHLVSVPNLKPAFCAESQLLTWDTTKVRYLRIDVIESGWKGVWKWGMYNDWIWSVKDRFGLPRNSKTEAHSPKFAAIRLFDEKPDDYPEWNAHPDRAYPVSRLHKDWLLQDYGFDGFWEASQTNGPAYYEACAKRRAKRLAKLAAECPSFVYVKHYTISGDAELSGNAAGTDECICVHPTNWRKGGQLCRLTIRPDGTVLNEVLLDKPEGCIRDPDIAHDGKTVVFAMRETFAKDEQALCWKRRPYANMVRDNGDDYHLYTFDLETRKLTQLTFSDPYPCADFEPCWLSDGRIAFQSTRCVQIIPCHRNENSNLYVCNADGSHIRRLGYDGGSTFFPQELGDGRIVYTRYEYNDRCARFQQPLMTMNSDGTMQTEYYGNNSIYPTSLIHCRPMPGSSKLIGIVGGHHVAQKGKLAIIDNTHARQGDAGITFVSGADVFGRPGVVPSDCESNPIYRKARAERDPFVEDFGTQLGSQWQYPYALSESDWVVTFLPEGNLCGSKRADSPNFGIYWQNAAGERELLAYDPAIECSQPIPIRPKPKARHFRHLMKRDPNRAYGTFYVQDVYVGEPMKGVPRGTIRKLRVCAVENRPMFLYNGSMYAPHDSCFNPFIAYYGDNSGEGIGVRGCTWDIKHVLGEVDVAADGSCVFEAPACNPVYFQLLDAEGRCVQTMRSWATLMPGEFNSCIGCHENKLESSPPTSLGELKVQRLQPAPGQGPHPLLKRLDEGGRLASVGNYLGVNASRSSDPQAPTEGFSYRRLIQPILNRSCVKCHDGSQEGRPDLTDRLVPDPRQLCWDPVEPIDAHRDFTMSYWNLTAQGRQTQRLNWYSSTGTSRMIPPYAMGSTRSSIMDFLTPAHHGVETTETDRRLFACWIDLGIPFGGSYAEATRWNDEDVKIFEYHQKKRDAFAEREMASERDLP